MFTIDDLFQHFPVFLPQRSSLIFSILLIYLILSILINKFMKFYFISRKKLFHARRNLKNTSYSLCSRTFYYTQSIFFLLIVDRSTFFFLLFFINFLCNITSLVLLLLREMGRKSVTLTGNSRIICDP